MNEKAQIDFPIITLVIVVMALLFVAPFLLKMMHSIQGPMSSALGNVSGGEQAKTSFDYVMNTGSNLMDKVVIAIFFIALIVLFISAFMIDTSPFWVIIYIFLSFLLVIFTPNIISSLDGIYSPTGQFATEVTQLTFMNVLRQNFMVFIVGIIVLTGIIIYGKIAMGGPSRK